MKNKSLEAIYRAIVQASRRTGTFGDSEATELAAAFIDLDQVLEELLAARDVFEREHRRVAGQKSK